MNKLVCPICGNEMVLYDVDFIFRGCEDRYYDCNCNKSSCIEIIRYGKSVKLKWTIIEEDKEVEKND